MSEQSKNMMEQYPPVGELHNLDTMSKFQKEVVAALKSLGYKYKYNKVYQLNDYTMQINIDSIKTIKDLITVCYKNGAQEKVWEIKRVLEVVP